MSMKRESHCLRDRSNERHSESFEPMKTIVKLVAHTDNHR